MPIRYRPEVDGLRAVAVVPVILFHAGVSTFGGGFIGVDVFFVISGYLITLILITDMEHGTFSLLSFYERRARRLLPALFFVMAVCVPFAWMWMLPGELLDFSQSLVAVSLFGSNVLFWQESGYFDAAAEAKPLLHTWSLAVEEQYYLVFPVALLLAWRLGIRPLVCLCLVALTLSLLLSEWAWRHASVANFYLLPTRLWELLAGSLAALTVHRWGGVQKQSNMLSLLGLTAILACVFIYDAQTPFPSLYTLVPVLGTVLLLLYAGPRTLAARLLSVKGIVAIGLVSYSAYLWHQPLLAFGHLRSFGTLQGPAALALALAAFPLAWLSWKFIEQPFRDRRRVPRRAIFMGSVTGLGVFLSIGLVGHVNKGFPARLDVAELPFLTMRDDAGSCFDRAEGFCNITDPRRKIVVIGDSTMQPVATALEAVQQEFAVVPITAAGCLLAPGYGLRLKGERVLQPSCAAGKAEEVLALLRTMDRPIVLYGGMFSKAATGYRVVDGVRDKPWHKEFVPLEVDGTFAAAKRAMVADLDAASAALFFLEFPEFGVNVQALRARQSLLGVETPAATRTALDSMRALHRSGAALKAEFARLSDGVVIDTFGPVCPRGTCSAFRDAVPMYVDHVHPSEAYARQVARQVLAELSRRTLAGDPALPGDG